MRGILQSCRPCRNVYSGALTFDGQIRQFCWDIPKIFYYLGTIRTLAPNVYTLLSNNLNMPETSNEAIPYCLRVHQSNNQDIRRTHNRA